MLASPIELLAVRLLDSKPSTNVAQLVPAETASRRPAAKNARPNNLDVFTFIVLIDSDEFCQADYGVTSKLPGDMLVPAALETLIGPSIAKFGTVATSVVLVRTLTVAVWPL
jgi:hypothetical protein